MSNYSRWEELIKYLPITFSNYRFDESITLPQKVNKMIQWINEHIKVDIEILNYLKDFNENFDKKLFNTVNDVLMKWKKDGIMEDLIKEIFDELFDEITKWQEINKLEWEKWLEDNKEIIESIDPGGVILSELINSRKPMGVDMGYPTLAKRLDGEQNKQQVMVTSHGAKGDGVTDDADSIRSALSSLKKGDTLFFPNGVYLIKKYNVFKYNGYYFFDLPSDCTLKFAKNAILKVADNVYPFTDDKTGGYNIFLGDEKENITISNMTLDFNGLNNLVPNKNVIRTVYGVQFNGGKNCGVYDSTFLNSNGRNAILFGGWNYKKKVRNGAFAFNNTIIKNADIINLNKDQNDFSAIYTDWDRSYIQNNVIQNAILSPYAHGQGGIEIHGSNNYVTNNTMDNCYPGVYICADAYVWGANKTYIVGDVVSPTKQNFYGLEYICVKSGVSGLNEPVWGDVNNNDGSVNWVLLGKAERYNQVVDNNIITNTFVGVMIWNNMADNRNTKITNNYITLKQLTESSTRINFGIVQMADGAQFNSRTKLFNSIIENNEISYYRKLSEKNGNYVTGIQVSSFDNLKISSNTLFNLSNYPIEIRSSVRGIKTLTALNNIIKDFGLSNVQGVRPAIYLQFENFPSSNVKFKDNVIDNTLIDDFSSGFSLNWVANNPVTNIKIDDNVQINVKYPKSGSQQAYVWVTPENSFGEFTGYVKESDGYIIQYTRVTYTGNGTDQVFNFPLSFNTLNMSVQLTSQADITLIPAVISKTKDNLTLRANKNGLIHILAIGN